jgi:hypothetical protein
MSVANSSTVVNGSGAKGIVAFITTEDGNSLSAFLLARLTSWSVAAVIGESVWADSDSEGFDNAIPTKRSATGSLTGVLDRSYKAYARFLFNDVTSYPYQTDFVALVLYEDGDWSSPDEYWLFPRAFPTSYNQTNDANSQEQVEWSADWRADGKFYMPGDAGIPSVTYANYSIDTGATLSPA